MDGHSQWWTGTLKGVVPKGLNWLVCLSVIVVLRLEELYTATDNGLLYGYKVHTPGGPPGSANHPRGPAML